MGPMTGKDVSQDAQELPMDGLAHIFQEETLRVRKFVGTGE